jgi:lantibiotic modifying enzyme
MRTLATVGAAYAIALTARAQDPSRPPETEWLTAAREVAHWLDSVEVGTEAGLCWPVVPGEDPRVLDRNLYSGSCGTVLFMLEMSTSTGEERYLDKAIAGVDDIVAFTVAEGEAIDCGLWTGLAGRATTVLAMAKVTRRAADRVLAMGVGARLMPAARTPDGSDWHPGDRCIAWGDSTDIISGSAGIGCFLLADAEVTRPRGGPHLATAVGRTLLGRAIEVESAPGERMLKWNMTDAFPRLMPNFSHGTAGVSYFLARLAETLGPEEGRPFLDAALAGARYLESITETETCLVMHHEPEGEDLFYIGWCHGPTGTARLYRQLAIVTGDDAWNDKVKAAANSLVSMNLAENRTPGFWNTVGQCCGSAGVASFLLSASEAYDEPSYREAADAIIADILERATIHALPNGTRGRSWMQAEHRLQPEFLQAQTGHMQGASGIGLLLLHRHAIETGSTTTVRLPDSPW